MLSLTQHLIIFISKIHSVVTLNQVQGNATLQRHAELDSASHPSNFIVSSFGFLVLIKSIFHSLFQFFNCFSRTIA